MILIKHVLVATDFSEPSDAALSYGRELARTDTRPVLVNLQRFQVAAGGLPLFGFSFHGDASGK